MSARNRYDPKGTVAERLRARRMRIARIRRRALAAAAGTFALAWGVIFVQLVSGHDPALAKHSAGTASATTASAHTAPRSSSSGSTGSSNSGSSSSSSGSTSGSSGSASSGSTSSGSTSAVTTSQS